MNLIQTIKRALTKPEPNTPWCIIDNTRPGFFLCGREQDENGNPIPYDEVPEEMTCQECLRIEALLERHKEEQ